jgi:membrane-associated protease RseP (regulator of RpoE activity)
MMTALALLATLGTLGWGFYRAKSYGSLGLLSWGQSVALLAPWLTFFGLFAAGIYVSLVGMLVLLVVSTVAYVLLGRRIRAVAPQEMAKAAQLRADALRSVEDHRAAETTTPAAPPEQNIGEPVPIPPDDLEVIKSVFGLDSFFATETIPYQDGAVFNGNLRGELQPTYEKLSAAMQAKMGDRYRLFLIENQEGRPTVVVLPQSSDPTQSTVVQKILAVVLFVVTIGTCLEAAGFLQGFDFYAEPQRYGEVVPVAASVMAGLVAHEVGHSVVAQRYNVKLSWPFFLPTWQIGAFGGLTRFESLLPNRKALFDIAFAGPAAGGILSLGLLLVGLLNSHPGSALKVPTPYFEGSIFVGTIARAVLGDRLQESLVDVDPLVIAGWIGLIITAINLMPAGRLDGGRMVQAIYGRKIAGGATVATLILLGIVSLVNQLALYWAVLVLFLQRGPERPTLEDISEPDDARAAFALLALFFMVVILLPLTPSLAGRLGIGM